MSTKWLAVGAVCLVALALLLWKLSGSGFKSRSGPPVTAEGFQTPAMPNIPTDLIQKMDSCNLLKTIQASLAAQIDKASKEVTAPGQIELMRITKASVEQQLAATNCS